MYRTQVYLTETQAKKGKKIAKILGKSFSDIIRESLDESINKFTSTKNNNNPHPLAKFAGSMPVDIVDEAIDFINKNKKSKPINYFK